MEFSNFISMREDLAGLKDLRLQNGLGILSFGVSFLDEAIMGISKTDVIVIAAPSGAGKSEFVFHVAQHNAKNGKKVVVFALEAEKQEFALRTMYKKSTSLYYKDPWRDKTEKPKYSKWYHGQQEHLLGKYELEALAEFLKYDKLSIRYGGEEYTYEQFERDFASIDSDTDLVVLDHLHYLELVEKDENKEYKKILKGIRTLGKESRIPIILVSHIRKSDRRDTKPLPGMEDIHGSSDIFKIATKALILAPASDYVENKDPGTTSTFMRVVKCRVDGSAINHIGALKYNYSLNAYEDEYVLGKFKTRNAKPVFEQEEPPDWATHAKSLVNY